MKTTRIIKIGFLSVCTMIFIISCNREKLDKHSYLTETSEKKTELDNWVEKNFTEPYNLRLLYRYDDTRTEQDAYVVPVSYEKAVQMANIIKYLFLDAYKKHTPKGFLKDNCPKIIMLIGSGAYNPNNTVKLGFAENGSQIALLGINNLDSSNLEYLYHFYFRVIYHEFSHILHQKVDFSQDFKRISAKEYVGGAWSREWIDKGENASLEAGFISDYSSQDTHEDFVELIAHYLTYSPEKWNKTLNLATGKEDGSGDKPGKKILEQKIAIVLDYMQNTWNINLNELRDEIQDRASKIGTLDLNSLN